MTFSFVAGELHASAVVALEDILTALGGMSLETYRRLLAAEGPIFLTRLRRGA